MLRALATWWASRMLELVPARLSRDATTVGPAVIVDAGDLSEPDQVRLIRRRNGQETPLGPVGSTVPSREVAVRVPSRLLLEQRVTLPLAAERDPGRVLQYDM